MIARMLILTLIAMLALPIATLTPPGTPGQPAGSDVAVAAKGKKHKKAKKPKVTTVTRTERQTVTRTFTSTTPITFRDGDPVTNKGRANPYPSAIAVNTFANGTITDINVLLNDFSHAFPDDVDIMLAGTHLNDRNAIVMSDVGSNDDVANLNLVLDDQASLPLPDDGPLISGTFQPTNYGGDDTFLADAPAPTGNSPLSTFVGQDPNGTWQLWVIDDLNGDLGSIDDGWALEITADIDVAIEEQGPAPPEAKKDKKKKGKGRR